MRKIVAHIVLFAFAMTLMSMAVHKYYVAVFQMNYMPAKKEIQMTSRIFIDDLEAAFLKKYKKHFYIGSATEVADTDEYIKKYIADKLHIKVNGKEKSIKFLGKETEEDILICYFTLPAENAVKSINVSNTVLLDMFDDQQNIVHANVKGNKKSLLLTNSETDGLLEF
jgi:tRNA(Leu) C34 or U34 (ribose-2'-O)-methylase TrmL